MGLGVVDRVIVTKNITPRERVESQADSHPEEATPYLRFGQVRLQQTAEETGLKAG